VTLYTGTGSQVGTPVNTDSNGNYTFSGLPPGDYYVVFSNLPAGSQFSPADQGGDDSLDNDANPGNGQSGTTSLGLGESDSTLDAGIHRPVQISGQVWEDADNSQTVNGGETGIPEVTVELLDEEGNVIRTTQTDEDGYYGFNGLEPGNYSVRESDPGGYASTTENEVPVTLTQDVLPLEVDFGDRREVAPVGVPILSPLGWLLLSLGIGMMASRRGYLPRRR